MQTTLLRKQDLGLGLRDGPARPQAGHRSLGGAFGSCRCGRHAMPRRRARVGPAAVGRAGAARGGVSGGPVRLGGGDCLQQEPPVAPPEVDEEEGAVRIWRASRAASAVDATRPGAVAVDAHRRRGSGRQCNGVGAVAHGSPPEQRGPVVWRGVEAALGSGGTAPRGREGLAGRAGPATTEWPPRCPTRQAGRLPGKTDAGGRGPFSGGSNK
eukprot:scaffold28946_cov110-Isochrysis_galbana.AAC.1